MHVLELKLSEVKKKKEAVITLLRPCSLWLVPKTRVQQVVSDLSGSRLKECPHMKDPDQQTATTLGSPHHPVEGAVDP